MKYYCYIIFSQDSENRTNWTWLSLVARDRWGRTIDGYAERLILSLPHEKSKLESILRESQPSDSQRRCKFHWLSSSLLAPIPIQIQTLGRIYQRRNYWNYYYCFQHCCCYCRCCCWDVVASSRRNPLERRISRYCGVNSLEGCPNYIINYIFYICWSIL